MDRFENENYRSSLKVSFSEKPRFTYYNMLPSSDQLTLTYHPNTVTTNSSVLESSNTIHKILTQNVGKCIKSEIPVYYIKYR